VLPGWHLSAWAAAATTIAAAFATHLAAAQHQRIAASYAATADQLDRLIADVDPASADPDRQAQFVADVERVLAAQNDGWTDLLSLHAPK
jgi:cytochrome c551/c552